ncbi:hypothetical protein GCM10025760_34340 [Microbacterium yannicii]|uniref:Uncharacterized protein n=1 Tax=Microbacterium yannicii TaxID=671622 RepID=A0ABP9MM83_9MICO|nr:hypothetical protein [Microbacterium yannicii]MCO5951898.1 hypothetical protein [Microbacterium yannicii]
MPEALYRGESWDHQQARERLAERDRQAAQRERVDALARRRQAEAARGPESAPPAAEPPAGPAPAEQSKRRTWRDLGPDDINRYALAESRRP